MNFLMRGLLIFLFIGLVPMPGESQTCAPGTIPNYTRTFGTVGRTTLSWAHPAGYGPGTVYEILRAVAPSYCAFRFISNFEPIAQTTQTSFDLTFVPTERFLCYAVRVMSCPSVITSGCFPVHNFSSPPVKPNLISAAETAPGQVTITYSHDDERGPLVLQRGAIGAPLVGLTGLENCPGGAVRTYIDEGPTGVPAGTYRYRLASASEAGSSFSDEKVVVVGAECVPPQEAPQVSSPNTSVIVGQEATVVWTATEMVRNYLIELARDSTFSALLHTIRLPGTSRSAALRFPFPGTYFARVVAERICGRKEGVPVLSFNVAPPPALVLPTARPSGMLQVPGQTATDSYTLTNFGGSSTTIRLTQQGDFFSQTPTEFTLAPRASQIVTLTARSQADGNQKGLSIPIGEGVIPGMAIPVFLLTAARPAGNPDAQAERNRIDLATPVEQEPQGVLRFTNRGSGTVRGLLVSDAPWIIPEIEFVVIEPGQTGSFNFRVSRLLRPGGTGTVLGRAVLIYLEGSPPGRVRSFFRRAFSTTPPPGTKATLVTVTDTVKPAVTPAAIPPLPSDQTAFFVPGVGRLQLGETVITSDVSILNADSLATLDQLQLFLTTSAGSSQTGFSALAADQTLKLSDVTKSVFNSENQVGSLQVRTSNVAAVAISAALVVDGSDGAHGTAVPVFRADRRIGPNESLYLAGLSKGASSRTDLYLQEMAGQSATGTIEFLSAAGTVLSSSPLSLQPYAAAQLIDAIPSGSVSAVVTNTSTTGATLQAYATPVDLLSNDSWSVADWSRQQGYSPGEPVVIPIAGKLQGLNGAAYQTDVTILSSNPSPASGTLTYFPEVGPAVERPLTFGPRESRSFPDVISSLFELPEPTVGYLVFTPASGSFAVTSRTYRVVNQGTSFSATVPALPLSSALALGQVRKISGIEDSTLATSRSGKPGTGRTNFAILETAGAAATVRATLRYTAVQGSASAVGVSSRDFMLEPRQFLMMSSISNAILQERRAEFGDLTDIQVDFEVIDGTGRVMVFVSTLDNATSDAIVRAE